VTARKGKEGGVKCRHRNGVGYRWEYDGWRPVTQFVDTRLAKVFWLDRVTCDCGTWLPLGDSKDEPEAVKVEILAAFLVNPGGFVHVAHKDYHDQDWIDEDYNFDLREDCTGCQAEYLARAIATHEGRSQ